jgi:hypothetical protein
VVRATSSLPAADVVRAILAALVGGRR